MRTLIASVRISWATMFVATALALLPYGYAAQSSAITVLPCTISTLSITATSVTGAGGNDGGVLHYKNISSHSCSLHGYPTVIAMDGANRKAEIAVHRSWGYLGGWQWGVLGPNADNPTDVATKIPNIILAPGKDGASSMYQYSENASYACPKTNSLRVGLPRSTRLANVSAILWACTGLEANPFVPGNTGTVK